MTRDRPVGIAYWLVVCVLVFYQHPASMALRSSARAKRATSKSEEGQCEDWEVYDGVDCVCASDKESKCKDSSGMVCDTQGKQYKSKCHFALETCQLKVNSERQLKSCGACKFLRLTGGQDHSKGTAIFKREGADRGLSTRYRSTRDRSIEVFFVPESGVWAIGRTNASGNFVSMIQMIKASNPQDGNPGMLVPRQTGKNIKWEYDQSFQLDCIESTEVKKMSREKRFIFTLIFAITMAVTVVTTTLKIVQSVRGCLYYPSVCSMRDNIKNNLLPGLKRDKDRFLSNYGDPNTFTSSVEEIHSQILDVREKIMTIRDLRTSFNFSLSTMVDLFKSLGTALPDLKDVLLNYDSWVASVSKSVEFSLRFLPLEIVMALPTLFFTSATSLALAASGIGLVFAFAFGIVDVVSSVVEERKVRDQLQKKENELNKARRNLDNAFRNMKKFQIKFCWHIITFLYGLTEKGKPYHNAFSSLYSYISQTFGSTMSRCNNPNIISKINKVYLHSLKSKYLPAIINLLSEEENALRKKIDEIKETNAFLDEIKSKVQKKENPTGIFRFIKTHKPLMTKKLFKNLFDLLKLISESMLPQQSCFWGYNLQNIRSGRTSGSNYMHAPICISNEITSLISTIRAGVQKHKPPCQIARQVHGEVFRSVYHVLRFIADNILSGKSCYWGYDLNYIQGYGYDNEMNTAKIDSKMLQTLRTMDWAPVSVLKTTMANQFSIKSERMKNFILCNLLKNQATLNQLGCTVKDTSCFPAGKIEATCS